MKIGRRALSFSLALLLVVTMLPLSALAAPGMSQNEAVNTVYDAMKEAIAAPDDGVNAALTGIAKLNFIEGSSGGVACNFINKNYQAMDLISIPFLSKLFAYEKITSMTLSDIEWGEDYLTKYLDQNAGQTSTMLTILSLLPDMLKQNDNTLPIAHGEEDQQDLQMLLMLGVLASVLARYDGKAAELSGADVTISFLAGTQVPVTLNGEIDGITFSAPVTIYFCNSDDNHKVTFTGVGVTDNSPTEYQYDATITFPEPKNSGQFLYGWKKTCTDYGDSKNEKKNVECGVISAADASSEKMGALDVTYEAQWTSETKNVIFHYEDDTSTTTTIAQGVGEGWLLPETPKREGYTFLGWFTDSEDSDSKIGENYATENGTDIYVHWWKHPVVTFHNEYARNTDTKVTTDSRGMVPTTQAENLGNAKRGYTFHEWLDSEENGKKIDFDTKVFTGDTTVYAKVTANTYTVEFKPGDSDVTGSMESQQFTYDVPQELKANEFTRKGYDFDVWSQSRNKTYTDCQEVSNLTYAQGGKVTLTAKWKAKTYDVTLDADGGEVNGKDTDTITVTYDQTYGDQLTDPTREGYEFAGWQTAGGETVSQQTKVGEGLDVTAEGELKLIAQWNPKGDTKYTVKHWLQKVDGNEYELADNGEESKNGQTAAEVTLTPREITGFHVNRASSNDLKGTIGADGQTVMNIYYDRNTYQITWKYRDAAGSETSAQETYRYGAKPSREEAEVNVDTNSTHYEFTGWDTTPAEVTGVATYTALYTESHEARIGETNWRTLELALEHAEANDTVVLESDVTLTGDVEVPKDVMLLLPVSADDTGYTETGYNPDGTSTAGSTGKAANAQVFHTLTIPAESTLTVNGTVLVNAVTGRPGAGHYDMDVTGGYGEIALEGEIIVKDGGILDVCGYVTGSGTVTAEPGGEVRDLYIVRNWRGGSRALSVYPSVYPMNQADMHNIEVKTVINAGASLVGTVKMYANEQYYYTRFPQIDRDNGLIRQSEGSVVKTYDKNNDREKLVMDGKGSIEASELFIVAMTLTTGDFVYPIDGDMDLELSGDWTVNERLKLMPGVKVQFKEGTFTFAETTAKSKADMLTAIYDSFQDKDLFNDGTAYPRDRGEATLTLGGGTTTVVKSDFGGKILVAETATEENPAKLSFAPGIETTVTTNEADGTEATSKLRTLTFSTTVGGTEAKAGTNYVCYVQNGETVVKPSNDLPEIAIDYAAEALTGFVEGRSYTVNGAPAQVSGGKLGIKTEWLGSELAIADVTGDDAFLHSAAQTVAVPKRPDAPSGLYAVTPSSPEADNGSISGLDAETAYEYKTTDGDWTAVPEDGTSIRGLAVGTYQVRTAATANAFASEPAEVEVVYIPPTTPGDITTGHTNLDGSSTSTTTKPDGTRVVTDTAADGTVTEKTTKPDGTVTEKVTTPDNTVTEKTTDKDGVITETTTKPDNTVTEKVTQTDGSATERTTTPDGVVGQKSTDSEGKVTSAEVVIPKEAEKQDVVTAPVEVPAAKTAEEAPEISVRTESTESKKVEIPVTEFGPGTVAVIVHEDGTEEVVRDCTIGENGVVLNVEGDVTLKIVDKAETFADVEDANHWASNAVEFVAARELFKGTAENTFTPNGSMTRGMMVTVLYRLAYEPDAVEEGFADVKSDAYYSDAVAWAAENGVVNGYADNTFAPDDNVSREQLVTILHRYAQKKGYATKASGTLANFADAQSVSSWASDAMSWAVELGLVNGTDSTHISPAKSATRAEVATILMRFCEKVVK